MKIFYITSAKFPSTRAHSVQIMKMSEAFSCFSDIVLYASRLDLPPAEVFKFYGVRNEFRLESSGWPFKAGFNRARVIWVFLKGFFALQRFKPDVIYAREFIVAFLILFFSGRKLAFEAHSIPVRYRFIFKLVLKRAFKIVVTNEGKRDEIIHRFGVSENKILLARNGVDVEEFKNILDTKEDLRKQLGLPQDKTLFGFVGNFTAKGVDKGLDLTFQAFSEINFPFNLVFVGDGKKEHDIYLKKAEGYGLQDKLILKEYIPHAEVPKWLKAMDFLILPYAPVSEHFIKFMSPLKAAEYMASGIPIISSDLPALKELLNNSALFFKAGDSEDYREKIERAKMNIEECKKFALSAQKRAAEEFSWEGRAKKILSFFGEN